MCVRVCACVCLCVHVCVCVCVCVFFYAVFLDFRDTFGSLPHNIRTEALDEINLHKPYINIIKDIDSGSFLQVICGDQLTSPIQLRTGIKTGIGVIGAGKLHSSPKPLKWLCLCSLPHIISPIPVQANADDVQVSSWDVLYCVI